MGEGIHGERSGAKSRGACPEGRHTRGGAGDAVRPDVAAGPRSRANGAARARAGGAALVAGGVPDADYVAIPGWRGLRNDQHAARADEWFATRPDASRPQDAA